MTALILSMLGIVVASTKLDIDTIVDRPTSERFKAFAGTVLANTQHSLETPPPFRCFRCAPKHANSFELPDPM